MSQQDDIRELKDRVKELEKSQEEQRVQKKVDTIVKLRCAAAWASIFTFISGITAILANYSDTAKEASKAAVKVIIASLTK